MDEEEFNFTDRGFRIFAEIKDSYRSKIRIQESSNASYYACWIFCEREGADNPSPHLSVNDAKEVIKALQEFVNWKETRMPDSDDGGGF